MIGAYHVDLIATVEHAPTELGNRIVNDDLLEGHAIGK